MQVSVRGVKPFVPSHCGSRRQALPLQADAAAVTAIEAARAARCRRQWCVATVSPRATAEAQPVLPPVAPKITGIKNVVVLGGCGRVGSSTAAALAAAVPSTQLSLGGRSEESFRAAVARRPELSGAAPLLCDIDDPASLAAALKGADLVIHAAGPFQRRDDCTVLEAAIAAGVPYMDVCDDTDYSQRAKALHSKAQAAGVPCITTTGIYPGVSNVMAAHTISINRGEYNADGSYAELAVQAGAQPKRLLYSYFTAGTGGAGPTILETTLLLAGQDVVAYKDGRRTVLPPLSNRRVVDFGMGVGRRSVYLYNLPEVSSGHQVLGVPNVSARFGTAPDPWNWGMVAMAWLAPKSMLANRQQAKQLARVMDPLIRRVDALVGEKVAILVEVEYEDGRIAAGLYVHPYLSKAVGTCSAAFARCMLAGQTQPGVWFPEERGALADRRALLGMATDGCKRFLLNRTPWQFYAPSLPITSAHRLTFCKRRVEPHAQTSTQLHTLALGGQTSLDLPYGELMLRTPRKRAKVTLQPDTASPASYLSPVPSDVATSLVTRKNSLVSALAAATVLQPSEDEPRSTASSPATAGGKLFPRSPATPAASKVEPAQVAPYSPAAPVVAMLPLPLPAGGCYMLPRRPTARRLLFGPEPALRPVTDAFLAALEQQIHEGFAERWGFDTRLGRPLPHPHYQWEPATCI